MSNTTYLRSPINFLGFLNIIEKDIEYKVLDGFRVYCTIVIIRTAPPPPPQKKKKKKKIYIYIYIGHYVSMVIHPQLSSFLYGCPGPCLRALGTLNPKPLNPKP